MATELLPLNKFLNVATKVTTDDQEIYEVGRSLSAIILNAVFVNYTAIDTNASLILRRLNPDLSTTDYSLVPDMEIPANEVFTAVAGRMVLTEGDVLIVRCTAIDRLDFIMSINEAANE
jgi:hypothetical protein